MPTPRCFALHVVLIELVLVGLSWGFLPSRGPASCRCQTGEITADLRSHLVTNSVEDPLSILVESELSGIRNLIDRRSEARWNGEYDMADQLRVQIDEFPMPKGYKVMLQDVPRSQGGKSTWNLARDGDDDLSARLLPGTSVLQLAHAALGLAVQASVELNLERARQQLVVVGGNTSPWSGTSAEDDSNVSASTNHAQERQDRLESLVDQAKDRLSRAPQVLYELSGRKAADAAFWFAMAGVSDTFLFDGLVMVATLELERFGSRPSCRPKDIYQILERFAAAGLRSAPRLEEVASQCLTEKQHESDSSRNITSPLLDYHSDRSLLLIWKFSTKQKKQRAFLQQALTHWERSQTSTQHAELLSLNEERSPPFIDKSTAVVDSKKLSDKEQPYDWNAMFSDPFRPLVVDVGCGMGVSLLGMASSKSSRESIASSSILLNSSTVWSDCNFLGVDLGALGIAYGKGLATRWGLDERLEFVVDSAERCLEQVHHSYPGPVYLCCVQFPTPYRLAKPHLEEEDMSKNYGGNSQLPTSAYDGFMVSESLLRTIHKALSYRGDGSGKLLLHSNCEDVAVWMRNLACDVVGFSVQEDHPAESMSLIPSHSNSIRKQDRIPQRSLDWIEMGGERASGRGWLSDAVLHKAGATETEIACEINGTPIHRCVLRPKSYVE